MHLEIFAVSTFWRKVASVFGPPSTPGFCDRGTAAFAMDVPRSFPAVSALALLPRAVGTVRLQIHTGPLIERRF